MSKTLSTIVTNWTSISITTNQGSNATTVAFLKRIGDEAKIRVYTTLSGAPDSTAYILTMPSLDGVQLAIDLSKLPAGGLTPIGSIRWNDFGARIYAGDMVYNGGVPHTFVSLQVENGTYNTSPPFSPGSGDSMAIEITVPILGW